MRHSFFLQVAWSCLKRRAEALRATGGVDRDDALIRVRHTVGGSTVRLKRERTLSTVGRRDSRRAMTASGSPAGSDHSTPRPLTGLLETRHHTRA